MPLLYSRTMLGGIENRSENSSVRSRFSPIYIVGFGAVGLVLLVLFIWLGVRYSRKRASATHEQAHNNTVRRIVEDEPEKREPPPTTPQAIQGTAFSRESIAPQIILPDKAITLPAIPSAEDIINFHRQSGNFPRPFSFALNASSPSSSRRSSLLNPNTANKRSSIPTSPQASTSSKRFSAISTTSTVSSVKASHVTVRTVRQIFTPVLPDEFLLTRVGERLTVLHSFDDGWCIVGRDNPAFHGASGPKSLFPLNNEETVDPNMEVGVVPIWCFIKPTKGLRTERPVRSSSLGITVQVERPSSRDSVISWSNF